MKERLFPIIIEVVESSEMKTAGGVILETKGRLTELDLLPRIRFHLIPEGRGTDQILLFHNLGPRDTDPSHPNREEETDQFHQLPVV